MSNEILNPLINNSMFNPMVNNNNIINPMVNNNNNIINPMINNNVINPMVNNNNNNIINPMINNNIINPMINNTNNMVNPMINSYNNMIDSITNDDNNIINPMINSNNNMINSMNNINNNIINPIPKSNNNIINNNITVNIFNTQNNLKNLINENNNQNINPMIKNEMNFIFQELNPMFNSMNQENFQIKQIWENLFLTIFNKINGIKGVKRKIEEKRIIINYYNICKKEIYFNLELNIENIIAEILSLMGYNYGIKKYERIKENQTTKYIIENPIMKLNNYYFDEYNNFFFQFKNENLYSFLDKKGYDIGLEEGEEILFKLNNDYIMENFKKSKRKYNISFTFDNLDTIDLIGYENELLISLIKRFFKESNFDFELINKKIFIIFKGTKLTEKDFILKLEQFKVNNGSNFLVFVKKDCEEDSTMIDMIDSLSGKLKSIDLGKKPPIWRQIKKGLNFFGICDNSNCKVFKKEVVYCTDLKDKLLFDLNEKVLDIKCPICSKIMKLKSCGFWDCEYQIIGKRIIEGDLKEYETKTKEANNDNLDYFDDLENKDNQWIELNIFVLPKQKIKYKRN